MKADSGRSKGDSGGVQGAGAKSVAKQVQFIGPVHTPLYYYYYYSCAAS